MPSTRRRPAPIWQARSAARPSRVRSASCDTTAKTTVRCRSRSHASRVAGRGRRRERRRRWAHQAMKTRRSKPSMRGALPAPLREHLESAEEKESARLRPVCDAVPAFRRPACDYTFDVKYYGGDRVEAARALERAAADVGAADATSLYLHFPLCPYVCRFCHYHVRAATGASGERSLLLADLLACAAIVADHLPGARSKRVRCIYLRV